MLRVKDIQQILQEKNVVTEKILPYSENSWIIRYSKKIPIQIIYCKLESFTFCIRSCEILEISQIYSLKHLVLLAGLFNIWSIQSNLKEHYYQNPNDTAEVNQTFWIEQDSQPLS